MDIFGRPIFCLPLETTAKIQARNDGEMSESDSSEDGEKRWGSGYILRVEPTGYSEIGCGPFFSSGGGLLVYLCVGPGPG